MSWRRRLEGGTGVFCELEESSRLHALCSSWLCGKYSVNLTALGYALIS